MSYQLPPNLLRLFAPRPHLPFKPAIHKDTDPRRTPIKAYRPLDGVAAYLEMARQEAADRGQATNETETEKEGGAKVDEQGRPLTHTEQTKRELRREERKKKMEEGKAQSVQGSA